MSRVEGLSESATHQNTTPQSAALQNTTPVPNILLDTFLPRLSDTELRVLLVVDRATLGWKEGSGRKETDWLSHRQLQARTGRAGASVSRAIEALVRRGLLIVQDGAGQARDSAHSRRAVRGRLYYRLSDALLNNALLAPGQTPLLTKQQAKSQRPATATTRGEIDTPVSETLFATSPARLQKLKTTKETGTKEKTETMSSSKTEVKRPQSTSEGAKTEAIAIEYPFSEDLEEQVERFLNVFAKAYRLARPDEEVPPLEEAERVLLRGYLKQQGVEVLEAWLPAFFQSSFDYARRRNWSPGAYLHCLFILRAQADSNPHVLSHPLRKSHLQRASGES